MIPYLILIVEMYVILILNKIFVKIKHLIYALLICVILWFIGIYLKQTDSLIDYRFFQFPIIEVGLLGVFQIVFKIFFKSPFHLYMRGFEYPEQLKTNSSGFNEFLCGILSISLVIISLFIIVVL